MPQSAPTLCPCGYVKQNGESCPRCKPKRDAEYNKTKRNKEATAFYQSSRWREVRELARKQSRGLCVECMKQGNAVPLDVIDHILPLEHFFEFRFTLSNLQGLCHTHHNEKGARDKEKYKDMK